VAAAAAALTIVPSGRFVSLVVRDGVANVLTNLSSLESLAASGTVTALNLTGTAPFTFNLIAAAFGANADVPRLGSISNTISAVLTDGGTPTITVLN
jgi:hypothetical protein